MAPLEPTLKFPEMRNQLIVTVEALSDFAYQKECWIKDNCPPPVQHDNFDLAVHFLFDDSGLDDDVKGMIGYILKDDNEADLVSKLCKAIDEVLIKYGNDLTDHEYIHKPE